MRVLPWACLLVLCAQPAAANDSTAALGAGGLIYVTSDAVEMRSEDLLISMDKVEVRYEFLNSSANDVTSLVAFPMPDIKGDIDFIEAVPTDDPVNFLGFKTTVDGKPVEAKVQQHASALGIDQTALLTSLGIPLAPHLKATRDALDRLPRDKWDELIRLGLAGVDEYNAGRGWERHLAPLWVLSTAFYWEQTFPAGKTVVVKHSYRPSVGRTSGLTFGMEEVRATPWFKRYSEHYCIDKGFLDAVDRRRKPDGSDTLVENRVDYILRTAANWAGAIKQFRLVVDKGAPDNLVSFCGDDVKKIAPTQFEMTKDDFYPEDDLSILFLTPASQLE